MPVTQFAGNEFKRTASQITPPVGWFSSDVTKVFALASSKKHDSNVVGYTTSLVIREAWEAAGVLPEGHSVDFRPALTHEHIFGRPAV